MHERPDLSRELRLWQAGYRAVAGVDEAGRGAWAGPVVAAAVIFPPQPAPLEPLLGRLDDSKRLTPKARAELFPLILARAMAVGVGFSSVDEISELGVVNATVQAMCRALTSLSSPPDFLLLDYLTLPEMPLPQESLPHGDALSFSIAAASIVAKVTRDRWMAAQDSVFAGYGFARHKGYGTAEHRAALERLGPCPLHRVRFRPVAEALAQPGQAGWP